MAGITNKQILDAINKNASDTHARLDSLEKQVKRTNGRVTELEQWRRDYDTIENYKNKNRPTSDTIMGFEKDLLAKTVTIIATLATALAYVAQQGG